jgi:hypothetical protein
MLTGMVTDSLTPSVTDRAPDRALTIRSRGLGALYLVSGLSFIAAVVNPPMLPYWADDTATALQLAAAHREAWAATVWLLSVAVVAAAGAVWLTSTLLRTAWASLATAIYVIGAALGVASTTFDLSVSSTQLGVDTLPDWYLGAASWADGLATTYFAVLSPVALIALAVAVLRTGTLPRWTAVMLIVAAAGLLGQFAAWGGALPFQQFLAFVAIGVGLIVRPATRTDSTTHTPEGA